MELPPGTVVEDTKQITQSGFADLGAGAREETGLHFTVKAYDSDTAKQVASLAEDDYGRIMHDTSLYSFVGSKPYPITVYRDHTEYLQKTRMPEWSGGAAVGNTLYVYVGPDLEPTVAHELTHILFYEALGDRVAGMRWLNEGLAVFEETQTRMSAGDTQSLTMAKLRVAQMPMPFQQMMAFVPASEKARLVDAWYLQCADVVRYMIENGGRLGFSQFLRDLRDGHSVDDAVRDGFPGRWTDVKTLEGAWQSSLGR